MSAGLDDNGEVVLDIGSVVHSTVALEEYLHGQYLRTLLKRVGVGHTRAWLDDALQTFPHEVELKTFMLQFGARGRPGEPIPLNQWWLQRTRLGYEALLAVEKARRGIPQ